MPECQSVVERNFLGYEEKHEYDETIQRTGDSGMKNAAITRGLFVALHKYIELLCLWRRKRTLVLTAIS